MKKLTNPNKNRGFSLVELIIVIAIMAILAGAIAPSVIRYIRKARAASATDEARVIVNAIHAAFASEAGGDIEFSYNSTYTPKNGSSMKCGIMTNWALSRAQNAASLNDTDPSYPLLFLADSVLKNLQSEYEASYKFYKFTGAQGNPIGANCENFVNQYQCPGVIVAYSQLGKVVFMEYYHYGCLIQYDGQEYRYLERETDFSGSDVLQYNQ